MRQRVLIVIGLASRPKLIADEPTSAIGRLFSVAFSITLRRWTKEMGTAVLFINYDLGLRS